MKKFKKYRKRPPLETQGQRSPPVHCCNATNCPEDCSRSWCTDRVSRQKNILCTECAGSCTQWHRREGVIGWPVHLIEGRPSSAMVQNEVLSLLTEAKCRQKKTCYSDLYIGERRIHYILNQQSNSNNFSCEQFFFLKACHEKRWQINFCHSRLSILLSLYYKFIILLFEI